VGKPEWKVEVPWLLVKGHQKILEDFVVIIGVVFVLGTWQNKQLPDFPLSHNNYKRDLRKECCTY
jgi:hypothetical protein